MDAKFCVDHGIMGRWTLHIDRNLVSGGEVREDRLILILDKKKAHDQAIKITGECGGMVDLRLTPTGDEVTLPLGEVFSVPKGIEGVEICYSQKAEETRWDIGDMFLLIPLFNLEIV